jgi:hypothetical protein
MHKMNALWEVTFFSLHVLSLRLVHRFHLHLVLMFTLKVVGRHNSGLYPAVSSVLDMMLKLISRMLMKIVRHAKTG